MKALFLIGNYYIQLAPLSRVARQLREKGVECRLLYIGDDAATYKTNPVEASRAAIAGISESPLLPLNARGGAINRAMQFARLVANRLVVDRFLAAENPSIVVIGTDIASMNTRLVLDACARAAIEVIIVPIVIPGPGIVNPDSDKGVPAAILARPVLRAMGLDRVVFFRGWVTGSYHRDGLIAIPDEPSRKLLENNGIDPSRLRVAGSPQQDLIFEAMSRQPAQCRAELSEQCGIPAEGKLVCFCTTVLQDLHGLEFALSMALAVKHACQGLMPGVHVAVKLHPREPREMVERYRGIFGEPGFHILASGDNLLLLRASDLVLGAYTSMLSYAALLGVAVLDIRLTEDPRYPLVFGPGGGRMHAASAEDVSAKVRALLYDESARAGALEEIAAWRESLGVAMDGRASLRVAGLIYDRALHARGAA